MICCDLDGEGPTPGNSWLPSPGAIYMLTPTAIYEIYEGVTPPELKACLVGQEYDYGSLWWVGSGAVCLCFATDAKLVLPHTMGRVEPQSVCSGEKLSHPMTRGNQPLL